MTEWYNSKSTISAIQPTLTTCNEIQVFLHSSEDGWVLWQVTGYAEETEHAN